MDTNQQLMIQRLKNAAGSGLLSEALTEALDKAVTILNYDERETSEAEFEGAGSFWWYACTECRSLIRKNDKYCHECGRRLIWK